MIKNGSKTHELLFVLNREMGTAEIASIMGTDVKHIAGALRVLRKHGLISYLEDGKRFLHFRTDEGVKYLAENEYTPKPAEAGMGWDMGMSNDWFWRFGRAAA